MFATIARIVAVSSLGAAMGSLPGMAAAADTPSALAGWTFGYAPYTYHFSEAKKKHDYEPDDEKHSYVWLLNAEKQLDERQVAGFAYFSNSFGQPSQYAYYGWQFRPLGSTP